LTVTTENVGRKGGKEKGWRGGGSKEKKKECMTNRQMKHRQRVALTGSICLQCNSWVVKKGQERATNTVQKHLSESIFKIFWNVIKSKPE
jgi:uncharacterized protein with PIN domain